MAPRSGVYYDTQLEENGWTALGLAASPLLTSTIALTPSRWVNIDDRAGLVFAGNGRPVYYNRHRFPVWRAMEDELLLRERGETESLAGIALPLSFIPPCDVAV